MGRPNWLGYSDGVLLPGIPLQQERLATGMTVLRFAPEDIARFAQVTPTIAIIMRGGAPCTRPNSRSTTNRPRPNERDGGWQDSSESVGELVCDDREVSDSQGWFKRGPLVGRYARAAGSNQVACDVIGEVETRDATVAPYELPIKILLNANHRERFFARGLARLDAGLIPSHVKSPDSLWYGGQFQIDVPEGTREFELAVGTLGPDDLALATAEKRREIAELYGHDEARIQVDLTTGEILIPATWSDKDAVAILFDANEDGEETKEQPASAPANDADFGVPSSLFNTVKDFIFRVHGHRVDEEFGFDGLCRFLMKEARRPWVVPDPHIHDDAFQEAALKLFLRGKTLDIPLENCKQFVDYFSRIWERKAQDLDRKKRRLALSSELDSVSDERQPLDRMIAREWAKETLPQLLEQLTERDRDIIQLRYREGCPWNDVAKAKAADKSDWDAKSDVEKKKAANAARAARDRALKALRRIARKDEEA